MPLEASSTRLTRKPRVFLSYGWQDNGPLLLHLKDDLRADGWDIWHDRDRISGGDAFTAEIEEGIRWCDVLLALMGPHSTRRANDPDSSDHRDSICHREISMADTVKGHGKTVPVMTSSCTPPLLLQGLDYVDMAGCPADTALYGKALDKLRGALEDALEGKVRYRAWYANLKPIDFRGVIREKTQGFHGRIWLFKEIDDWRTAGATQSLLILGDPGIGKSAVAARLVEQEPRVAGHFFCKHDEANTLEPGRLVQTLAAQVAACFPGYRARLDDPVVRERLDAADRDPVAALTQGVFDPLGKLNHPREEVRYLVIDALDEAMEHAAQLNILRVLSSSLKRMPAWLRLIATARNEPSVTERLRDLRFEPLDAGSPRNEADVLAYVRARLAKAPGATPWHTNTLCRVSNSNFLYVVQTLDDLDSGHLTLDKLEQLPPGLVGRYLSFFERQFSARDDLDFLQRVLDVMVAAVRPLRESELAAATGVDPEEDLPRLGRTLRQYLKHQDDWGKDPVYAFFHKSLSDWLTDPQRRGDSSTASVRRGHKALADWLFRAWGEGRTRWPEYLVGCLPTHLLACKRWDQLATVLLDPAYLEARTEKADQAGLLADFAATTCAEGMPAEHAARRRLVLIEKAIRDTGYIGNNPTKLFQLLWNSCWWYDCPEAAEGSPGKQAGLRLFEWMESWRAAKKKAGQFAWVRSLRPPAAPLEGAPQASGPGQASEQQAVSAVAREVVLEGGPRDNTVPLWDIGLSKQLASLLRGEGGVTARSKSSDGRLEASGSKDGMVQVVDLESGSQIACFSVQGSMVTALSWSADGQVLAEGSIASKVRLWDREGKLLASLAGHEGAVIALSWSSDAQLLASGSRDGTVRLWDRESRQQIACFRGHQAPVYALAWSSDAQLLVSGSFDGTMRVWDRESGKQLASLTGQDGLAIPGRRRLEVWYLHDVAIVTFVDRRIPDNHLQIIGEQLYSLVDEEGCTKLLLNLGNIEACSHRFLSRLITLHKKVQVVSGRLILCNASPEFHDLFVITKLDKFFKIVKEEQEGLQCF
jgi:anti-anti-sigma regulatory factor